jgi:hypothetical protein
MNTSCSQHLWKAVSGNAQPTCTALLTKPSLHSSACITGMILVAPTLELAVKANPVTAQCSWRRWRPEPLLQHPHQGKDQARFAEWLRSIRPTECDSWVMRTRQHQPEEKTSLRKQCLKSGGPGGWISERSVLSSVSPGHLRTLARQTDQSEPSTKKEADSRQTRNLCGPQRHHCKPSFKLF